MQDDNWGSKSAIGYRRRVCDEGQPRRSQRMKPESDQDRAGYRNRRPASRRAFKKGAEAECNQHELQPPVVGDAADAVLQDLEQTRLQRHPVQENQIQDDPADRGGGEQRTVEAGPHGQATGMPMTNSAIITARPDGDRR